MADGDRRIIQGGQQVMLDIVDLRSSPAHAPQDVFDMRIVQAEQPAPYNRCGHKFTANDDLAP